jgi:hypothetical protein
MPGVMENIIDVQPDLGKTFLCCLLKSKIPSALSTCIVIIRSNIKKKPAVTGFVRVSSEMKLLFDNG